jgi:hypothetical protein
LTSPLDQAQINLLGGPRQRISTTFETRPVDEAITVNEYTFTEAGQRFG